jgi:uncharacterized damage-inducible protein DinB
MSRPDLNRIPEWYHGYINKVKEDELMDALKNQALDFVSFLQTIPAEKRDYSYADGKWTIRQVLLHILDAERIFAYRALSFARKDVTPLPGFDENEYAENSKAGNRDWDDMIEEFKVVRRSTEILFGSLDNDQLESSGNASGKSTYVKGIGFIIAGHTSHHVDVIKERYLA